MRQEKRQKFRTGYDSEMRRVFRWMMAICLGLVPAGCGTPTLEEDPRTKALAGQLSGIDTVRLEEQSSSTPVTVEEATAKVAGEVTDPNESRPVVELTLQEVRAAALENNLDLKLELIDPTLAQLSLDQERAKFESVFFGSVRHTETQAVGTGTRSGSTSYDLGIEAPLHTGGSLAVGVPFGDSYPGGVADAAVSVSYFQSLLRGAGTRINMHSIRIEQHGKYITDAWTKLSAINILAGVDITYWSLFAARRELEVRREQYKLGENQLTYARDKVEAGAAPGIEIVGAEAGLGWRLEEVINAETAVRNLERDLKRIMNRDDMPVESGIAIVTVTEPDPLGLDLDEKVLAEAAIANRMDMIQTELQLAIDDLNIESARNSTLPDAALSYTYTAGTQSETIGGALGHLASNSFGDHSIGLSATIPLGNEVAKARLRRARLQRMRTAMSRERLQLQIRQDVEEAVNGLEQNWRRILAAEQAVAAAYRDYEVEQSQFQLGRSSSTEVLRRAEALGDRQLRRIRAFVQYEIAKVNLARTTGTLLGYGRIQLEPLDIEG